MVVLKTANVNNNQIVLDYDHRQRNNNNSGLVTSLNEEIGNGTPKIIPSNDIFNFLLQILENFIS